VLFFSDKEISTMPTFAGCERRKVKQDTSVDRRGCLIVLIVIRTDLV